MTAGCEVVKSLGHGLGNLPGVFVQRTVALTPAQAAGKRVEKRTTRGERSLTGAHSGQGTGA